jgi:hypothetical protein
VETFSGNGIVICVSISSVITLQLIQYIFSTVRAIAVVELFYFFFATPADTLTVGGHVHIIQYKK